MQEAACQAQDGLPIPLLRSSALTARNAGPGSSSTEPAPRSDQPTTSPVPSADSISGSSDAGRPALSPIGDDELRRDQRVYRALKKAGLDDNDRARLFQLARGGHKKTYSRADYARYQAKLMALAKARGIPTAIWPAKGRSS